MVRFFFFIIGSSSTISGDGNIILKVRNSDENMNV